MGNAWYHSVNCLLSLHELTSYVYFKIWNSIIFPRLFLTIGEQHRLRMGISHTVCLTMFSGVFLFGWHRLYLSCSAPLCEYGEANSGCYYQKGPPKFITNLLCPIYCNPHNQHRSLYRYRCVLKLMLCYSHNTELFVCCEVKSVLLECTRGI